jgi:hypothetical protein
VRLLAKDVEDRSAFLLPQRLVEFEDYELEMTEAGRIKYHAPVGAGNFDDAVAAKMLSHWGMINEAVGDITVLESDPTPATHPKAVAPRSADPDDEGDFEFDDDDYSDWVDPDAEMSDAEADQMIGVDSTGALTLQLVSPPSPEELLRRRDLWE